MRSRLPSWLPLLVALAVVATACGDPEAAPSPPTDPTTTTPAAETTTTAGPEPARAIGRADSDTGVARPADAPDETTPEAAGDSADSDRALGDLEVGECLDLPLGTDDTPDSGVTHADTRPCDEPHDAEVYSRVSLDEDLDAPYPGDEHVLAAADQVCLDTFAGYVGVGYVDSELEIVHFRPNDAAWTRGDRVVVCAVVAMDGEPLVGSVVGGS